MRVCLTIIFLAIIALHEANGAQLNSAELIENDEITYTNAIYSETTQRIILTGVDAKKIASFSIGKWNPEEGLSLSISQRLGISMPHLKLYDFQNLTGGFLSALEFQDSYYLVFSCVKRTGELIPEEEDPSGAGPPNRSSSDVFSIFVVRLTEGGVILNIVELFSTQYNNSINSIPVAFMESHITIACGLSGFEQSFLIVPGSLETSSIRQVQFPLASKLFLTFVGLASLGDDSFSGVASTGVRGQSYVAIFSEEGNFKAGQLFAIPSDDFDSMSSSEGKIQVCTATDNPYDSEGIYNSYLIDTSGSEFEIISSLKATTVNYGNAITCSASGGAFAIVETNTTHSLSVWYHYPSQASYGLSLDTQNGYTLRANSGFLFSNGKLLLASASALNSNYKSVPALVSVDLESSTLGDGVISPYMTFGETEKPHSLEGDASFNPPSNLNGISALNTTTQFSGELQNGVVHKLFTPREDESDVISLGKFLD